MKADMAAHMKAWIEAYMKAEMRAGMKADTKALLKADMKPTKKATVDSFAIHFICNCSRRPPHRPPPQKTLWGSNCKWVHCTKKATTKAVNPTRDTLTPDDLAD